MVPPVLVTSVHADAPTHILPSAMLQFLCRKISCGWFCRHSTWLLAASSDSNLGGCISLDSSRCVVYSGIRFKPIQAASKKLEQDEW